jgi:hypothetical protein
LSDFVPNGQHRPRERSAVAVRVLSQLDESAHLFARPGEEESPSIISTAHTR